MLPELAGDPPRAGGVRMRVEPECLNTEAGDVDRPASPRGRPPVALDHPGTAAEDFDLEPVIEGRVVADRDARPARRAAIRRSAFAVARQPAEGAGGAFDYIACVRAPAASDFGPRFMNVFIPNLMRERCYAAAAPGVSPGSRRRRQNRRQGERDQ